MTRQELSQLCWLKREIARDEKGLAGLEKGRAAFNTISGPATAFPPSPAPSIMTSRRSKAAQQRRG